MSKWITTGLSGLALCSLLTAAAALPARADAAEAAKKEQKAAAKVGKKRHDVYVCPMCPGIEHEGPGKCPKCGMNLVKKEDLEKKK